MTANYLVCNIEVTNKREINEINLNLFFLPSESNFETTVSKLCTFPSSERPGGGNLQHHRRHPSEHDGHRLSPTNFPIPPHFPRADFV